MPFNECLFYSALSLHSDQLCCCLAQRPDTLVGWDGCGEGIKHPKLRFLTVGWAAASTGFKTSRGGQTSNMQLHVRAEWVVRGVWVQNPQQMGGKRKNP